MKIKTKTVHIVDYDELNKAIAQHLGIHNYNFIANEECENDTSHQFNCVTDVVEDEYDAKAIVEALTGDHPYGYSTFDLLYALCVFGHIPPGDYLVEVSW